MARASLTWIQRHSVQTLRRASVQHYDELLELYSPTVVELAGAGVEEQDDARAVIEALIGYRKTSAPPSRKSVVSETKRKAVQARWAAVKRKQ